MKPLRRYSVLRVLIWVCLLAGASAMHAKVTALPAAAESEAAPSGSRLNDASRFQEPQARILPPTDREVGITNTAAIIIPLMAAAGAWFYAAAHIAKRHIAIRIFSFLLGVVCFVFFEIVREESFRIKVPILPDGSAPATFDHYLALVMPSVVITLILGFVWKFILTRRQAVAGTSAEGQPAQPRNWRPWAVTPLTLVPFVILIRLALVERYFRETYSGRVRGQLADIDWRNNMVAVQASMDIAAVVLIVVGLALLWLSGKR